LDHALEEIAVDLALGLLAAFLSGLLDHLVDAVADRGLGEDLRLDQADRIAAALRRRGEAHLAAQHAVLADLDRARLVRAAQVARVVVEEHRRAIV
jgi:hypothetical protein